MGQPQGDGFRLGAGICQTEIINEQPHDGDHQDYCGTRWPDDIARPPVPEFQPVDDTATVGMGERFAEQTGGHPHDAPDAEQAPEPVGQCDSWSGSQRCIQREGHGGVHNSHIETWTPGTTGRFGGLAERAPSESQFGTLTPVGVYRLLDERSRQIEVLEKEVVELQTERAGLRGQVSRQSENILNLSQEVVRLESVVRDQDFEIKRYADRPDGRSKEAEVILREMKDRLLERDNEVYERDQEIERQRGHILSLRGGIATTNDYLSSVQCDVERLVREFGRAQMELTRIYFGEESGDEDSDPATNLG